MCEQAARYCRDGVHKLLNKEQGKLRAQETRENREQPPPQPPQQPPNPAAVAGQDSESATAAQSGNSGAQPGGIDGLVRWIVTKMSDNKNIASREYASSKEDVAVAQEHTPSSRCRVGPRVRRFFRQMEPPHIDRPLPRPVIGLEARSSAAQPSHVETPVARANVQIDGPWETFAGHLRNRKQDRRKASSVIGETSALRLVSTVSCVPNCLQTFNHRRRR
ncbi:hypothetical protein F2P81_007436 [Scophthalmus maximus]|uniref:Uncharacterized protein n=1 Tax=Scophthalmus maximus TaxID=52904 RepID=A0A6A4TAU8_SCOMX|nr:hypothetical protein F2P81_007436 [Scophthalmus maximus]